ncbi:MAG: type II CAAX endopeptidase family protein [Tunicatimonas sp.]
MNDTFDWQPGDLPVVLTILLLTVGFVTYWFLAESPTVRRWVTGNEEEAAPVRWVVAQKLLGVVFLGVIPLLVVLWVLPYSLVDYGLGFKNTVTSLLWVLGLSLVIFPLNIRAARCPQNLAYYPMIRRAHWTPRLVLVNSMATILYLFAYELMFRGILLGVCTAVLGVWPAIAINIALYSTTHLPKGPAETIGAIPFGLLVCYITLTTGTIWVAVVVHVILSLSNDYLSVHYNPSMQFVRHAKETVSR